MGAASGSQYGFVAGTVAAGLAAALAIWGTLRPAEWADGGSLTLAGGAFLGIGVFGARLSLVSLFLFVVLALVAGHLLAFRRTVRPLLGPEGPPSRESFSRLYLNLLGRLALVGTLTFLLSVAVVATAPVLVVSLTTEVALFLLGLSVLLGLLAMALLREEPITLK